MVLPDRDRDCEFQEELELWWRPGYNEQPSGYIVRLGSKPRKVSHLKETLSKVSYLKNQTQLKKT